VWYALYTWRGETGWVRRNVFEDQNAELARAMVLVDLAGDGSTTVALVEGESREAAESFPAYGAAWKRVSLTG